MENMQTNRAPDVWDLADVMTRVENDLHLLRELLLMFKVEFPHAMHSLESSVAGGDLKSTAALSHKLKGMLSNLGGARAAAAAAKLEALASSGEKSLLAEALSALKRESEILLPEIEAHLTEVPN
jgi:HPt (histidine-containing phosphotransfer) domain-containing protein